MRRAFAATVLACSLACASAYQRTYDAETQRLEQEHAAQQAQESAAHSEAQRYAAVVYFATGSSQIDGDGQRELRWLVEKLGPYPQSTLDVQGFADATGGEATNQQLSQQRAQAVAELLRAQGIAPARIQLAAFSTQSPAASNTTQQGRRNNRRVEVTVR